MFIRIATGLVAMLLALAFYSIPIIKLKDIPLIIVVLIGVAMMVYEFWEEVRKGND